MNNIVLYRDKKECCGCEACVNICPKDAVSMKEDAYGFLYPVIDQERCIQCGACKTVCGYQKFPLLEKPKRIYAAASKDDAILRRSASGGIFAAVAEMILSHGGIVYGAALLFEDGKLVPKHIRADALEQLKKIQGSKYVQSEIGDIYRQVKKDLQQEKWVLFSGTPCQIAGLKQFLKQDYAHLFTMDLICHGVPNKRFFQDFIESHGKKLGGRITDFYFRDKSKGQSLLTRSMYERAGGKRREKVMLGNRTAYMYFFLKSYTYRESCYSCPFAGGQRIGDLTIGDFWGFHEEYPTYDKKQGLSNGKGISCVFVNTEKGKKLLEQNKECFILKESEFDTVARHNDQLCAPSKYNSKREEILERYKNGGYEAVDLYFRENYLCDIIKYTISDMTPKCVKRCVKRIIGYLKQS